MIFLVLIAILTVVSAFIAAPLFELVFGSLLLVPIVRFLVAFLLLKVGYAVPNGLPSLVLYIASYACVVALALKVFGRRKEKLIKADLHPIVCFSLVFSGAYGLCMLWPDFVDLGERLRDYAILASSIDSPVLPLEPWMEGIALNYYVYWYRFANLLSAVLGLEVWQAYHVILSFSISFYAAVLFQIVRVIMRASVGVSLAASVLIPFGANVAGIFSLKRGEKGLGWDPDNGWWGPSRVLQGAINEFPAWSFILGDAHPHFLNLAALPFFVLLLYRILSGSLDLRSRLAQGGLFVIAATLFLMASNAWEVPMWLGTVAATTVLGCFLRASRSTQIQLPVLKDKPLFEIVKGCVAVIVLLAALGGVLRFFNRADPVPSLVLLAVGIGFFVMSFPFKRPPVGMFAEIFNKRPPLLWVAFWSLLFVGLKISSQHIAPEGVTLAMVRAPIPVTTTSEILMHWGVQLSFLALGSIMLLRFSFSSVVMVGFLGLSLFYDKAALLLYALIAVQVVRILSDKDGEGSWHAVFENAILISGLVLILTPEFVFVNDSYGAEIERMNTIFKIYTTAWGLLGLGAVSVVYRCFKKFSAQLSGPGPFFPNMVGGSLVVVLAIAVSFFYQHTAPMRMGGLKSTGATRAEGLDTANGWHPGSADTIRALRTLPRGRVLEAQGKAYSYTSFVATLSAQPSYLGWPNHINLLTKEYAEVSRRQKVTEQIYNENDCIVRKELARSEKISYIVVGTLERKSHAGVENRDFSCFSSVISSGNYALYQIPLS